MANITYTAKPTQQPVSLAEVKRHLGLMGDDHDTDLSRMIDAATGMLQRSIGRQLVTAELRWTNSLFCNDAGFTYPIELPMPPFVSLDSFTYRDKNGDLQTLTSSDYQLVTSEELPARIYPTTTLVWPEVQSNRVDAVIIDYTAGYGGPDAVPAEAKQWILLVVRHWFDNPAAVGTTNKEMDLATRALQVSLGHGYYASTPL